MNPTTLGNRPSATVPQTKLLDFTSGDLNVRVSLRLLQSDKPDTITIDAQAFQVDGSGAIMCAADGRPSRTPGTRHTVSTSSLGDTHTLAPGWVREVGDYTAEDFGPDARHGRGLPQGDNATPYFDDDAGIGYRWSQGETAMIAESKVRELERIVANSGAILGASF